MSNQEPARILVVDDETDVTELLDYKLRQQGMVVRCINNPLEIIGAARNFHPNLIILDIMMPNLDGIQICRMLRADPVMQEAPIIFLTARTETEDRIKGLETGADDYICKPFDSKELLLRIKALLKRSSASTAPAQKEIRCGQVTINTENHLATIAGVELDLTATEFRLLQLLAERKGRVQSRENLLINVWNYEADVETRTVDTHIRRLREKLGDYASLIETIRGVGYRMVEKPY